MADYAKKSHKRLAKTCSRVKQTWAIQWREQDNQYKGTKVQGILVSIRDYNTRNAHMMINFNLVAVSRKENMKYTAI